MPELSKMMETFRMMVNDCIRMGMANNVTTRIPLARICYHQLHRYNVLSFYKICAISHAAGILTNRKKSIKRGFQPRQPYANRPLLILSYGIKIVEGVLRAPAGNRRYFDIPLNDYSKKVLSSPAIRIRSFTLTADYSVSICVSKEIHEGESNGTVGVDRNLRNLTIGNHQDIVQYDLSKAVDIVENTRSIVKSFKRNDVRVRGMLYRKYGMRRKYRVNQLLHRLTKAIVQNAGHNKTAIVFEDIRHIRRLYQKGNYQGHSYRSKLNGWSFAEVKRQVGYKAAWEGIPVIQLSVRETRGTSQSCPRCRKKITQVDRRTRQLWCDQCKNWMDRDVVAAMNISIKGLARFASSKGLASEAMKRNVEKEPLILRVDASKLSLLRRLDRTQNLKIQSAGFPPR